MSRRIAFRTLGLLLVLTCVGFYLATPAMAGKVINVDGIKVIYSKSGINAVRETTQTSDTLVITLTDSGGVLKVVVGPTAPALWNHGGTGSYVDVYFPVEESTIELPMLSLTGRRDMPIFVAGQLGSVDKFMLTNGVVGNIDLAPDLGLGTALEQYPLWIRIMNGAAAGPVFGVHYVPSPPLGAKGTSVTVPGEKNPWIAMPLGPVAKHR